MGVRLAAQLEPDLDQARSDGYDIPEVDAVELLGDAAEGAGRLEEAAVRYREAAAEDLRRAARELGDERWSDEDEATLAGYRAAL